MAHTHKQSEPGAADEAIAKGYEPHDLKLRGIFVFLGGLAATLVVVLFGIYAVMMGLVEHDRTKDAVSSPVSIKMEPVYAPLQPSLGYNGDHDNDHNWLDQDDMLMMRQKVDAVLKSSGTSSTGRKYISIESAIDLVSSKNMLPVKPVVSPVVPPPNPAGTWEGYTPTSIETVEPTTNPASPLSDAKSVRRDGTYILPAGKITIKQAVASADLPKGQ